MACRRLALCLCASPASVPPIYDHQGEGNPPLPLPAGPGSEACWRLGATLSLPGTLPRHTELLPGHTKLLLGHTELVLEQQDLVVLEQQDLIVLEQQDLVVLEQEDLVPDQTRPKIT